MKKIILFVLLSILPNFLMSACKSCCKSCKKPKGTNLAGRTDFDKTGSDNSSNDSSDDKKEIRQKNGYIYGSDNDSSDDKKEIRQKNAYIYGSDEYYKHEEEEKRQKIENEIYGPNILGITQGWNGAHFWYKHDQEPYITGDCGIYAAIRYLRHIEQLYPHNPDFKGLWKKYSIQELRNRLADLPQARPECRKPREWLYQNEPVLLVCDLLGAHTNYHDTIWNITDFKTGCGTFIVSLIEMSKIMGTQD